MKLALSAALAASMILPATVTRADNQIVVQSQRLALQKWVGAVSQRLDRSLDRAVRRPMHSYSDIEGFASVSFRCGSDGRPTEMTLNGSSGDKHIGKIAMRAVSGLESLHPLPDSVAPGQRFRANIIIAYDHASLERYARQAKAEEERRESADRGRPDAAIAINVIARIAA